MLPDFWRGITCLRLPREVRLRVFRDSSPVISADAGHGKEGEHGDEGVPGFRP